MDIMNDQYHAKLHSYNS